MESTVSERQKDLAEMVVAKWQRENYFQGFHLEQYDDYQLYPLIASRMRKMTAQMDAGELEPPEHLRSENLDEIFQDILNAGLLEPINPPTISEAEKQEAEREAAAEIRFQQFISDSDLKSKIQNLEMRGGQRAVSEWLHTKATAEEKKQFQRVFDPGMQQEPAQASLFIVHGARKHGEGVGYVSNDATFATARNRQDAVPLVRTRAQNAAEFLRNSGQYLNVIIEPIG